MNKGGTVTIDNTSRNAGEQASVPRMYGSDGIEVLTCDGSGALGGIREVGYTGLPPLCGFVHFLGGWGR